MTKTFTIQIGTHRSIAKLKDDLIGKGFKIYSYAEGILKKVKLAKKKETLNLEVWTVKELGFSSSATREQVYEAAQKQGLELCPAEVGPQLRLQYPDQPQYEWLYIAMEPITASDGDQNVFRVGHDEDEVWLNSNWYNPDNVWDCDDRWVFVRRKSLATRNLASVDSLALAPQFSEEEVRKLKKLAELIK